MGNQRWDNVTFRKKDIITFCIRPAMNKPAESRCSAGAGLVRFFSDPRLRCPSSMRTLGMAGLVLMVSALSGMVGSGRIDESLGPCGATFGGDVEIHQSNPYQTSCFQCPWHVFDRYVSQQPQRCWCFSDIEVDRACGWLPNQPNAMRTFLCAQASNSKSLCLVVSASADPTVTAPHF